ncbi:unnamed protein product, partial [Larinioides sclopetarius]
MRSASIFRISAEIKIDSFYKEVLQLDDCSQYIDAMFT